MNISDEDSSSVHQAMDGFWFTCGSSLKEVEVDEKLKPLFDRIFVRQNLSCNDNRTVSGIRLAGTLLGVASPVWISISTRSVSSSSRLKAR